MTGEKCKEHLWRCVKCSEENGWDEAVQYQEGFKAGKSEVLSEIENWIIKEHSENPNHRRCAIYYDALLSKIQAMKHKGDKKC